jgi:hypothetical protein
VRHWQQSVAIVLGGNWQRSGYEQPDKRSGKGGGAKRSPMDV